MEFLGIFIDRITGGESRRLRRTIRELQTQLARKEKELREKSAETHKCESKCAKRLSRLIQVAGAHMLKKHGIGFGWEFKKEDDDFILKSVKVVVSKSCIEKIKKQPDAPKFVVLEKFEDTGGVLRLPPREHCGMCHKGGQDE